MNLFEILKIDLLALSGGHGSSFRSRMKSLFLSHSFHLVFCYRLGVSSTRIPFIGKILKPLFEYFIRIYFASDISLKSKIGPGFVVVHGHDIVVGGDVEIGDNCKIFNGVTLGNKHTEVEFNAQPKLGANVVLSTGCKVLGAVSIGSHSIIGANSVVLLDVPPNSLAVGVPAQVKKKSR